MATPNEVYFPSLSSAERNYINDKFRLKIHCSDGQKFEDFFASLMSCYKPQFRKVKAWGSLGDRKNDGCIPDEGIYYQVFAPENIELATTQYNSLTKLRTDAAGLTKHWNNEMPQGVKVFKYVINDKFKGSHPDTLPELEKIKTQYKLADTVLLLADNFYPKLTSLPLHQIEYVLETSIPNFNEFKNVNVRYEILGKILEFLSEKDIRNRSSKLVAPDWERKIAFNKLSEDIVTCLNQGERLMSYVDTYLENNSYDAQTLQKLMSEVYWEVKSDTTNISDLSGDAIFWEIIDRCIPQKTLIYQQQMFPIMAKYFATCDIFEEPIEN